MTDDARRTTAAERPPPTLTLARDVYRASELLPAIERAALAARTRPVGQFTWNVLSLVSLIALFGATAAILPLLRALGIARGWPTLLCVAPLAIGYAVTAQLERRAARRVEALVSATADAADTAAIHRLALACANGVGDPRHHVRAVVRLAQLYFNRGELEDATTLYDAAIASRWPEARVPEAAVCAALLGDTVRARALCDALFEPGEARAVTSMLVDAIAALRAARYPEAWTRLEARWASVNANVSGLWMQRLRVLRAFAAAHLPVHDARRDEVDSLLAGAWPSPDAAYACLVARWDAMREFLAARRPSAGAMTEPASREAPQ